MASSKSGFSTDVTPEGKVAFSPQTIDGLSDTAWRLLEDLRDILSAIQKACAADGSNISLALKDEIQPCAQAVNQPEAERDAGLIFRKARTLRTANEIEQALIADDFKEPDYHPRVANWLLNLARAHNAFALTVEELRARDEAGVDPAARPAGDVFEPARETAIAVKEANDAFEAVSGSAVADALQNSPAQDDAAGERDNTVVAHSLYNLLRKHALRAYVESGRLLRIAGTRGKSKAGRSSLGAVTFGSLAYTFGGPVGATAKAVFFAKAFIAVNKESILAFRDTHPF